MAERTLSLGLAGRGIQMNRLFFTTEKRCTNSITIVFSLLMVALLPMADAADMFRWENQQGETVFGDRPPKDVDATPITVEEIPKTGNRFSSEQQIEQMHQDAAISREVESRQSNRAAQRIDYHCRDYVSQLNKAEIQIERSYNVRDAQKAVDLRKLIKKECGESVLSVKHDDWRCRQYRRDLEKAKIYQEHTPNSVDSKKVEVLTKQIARECR